MHFVFVLAVLTAVSAPAIVRAEDSLRSRPVTVSFLPPLSTNLLDGDKVRTNLALNIIGGYVGQLEGIELGSVFNIEKHDARGYQSSGGINLVGGSFTGVQSAAFSNIDLGEMNIAQFAGGLNFVRGTANGAQFAPLNFAGALNGVQFAAVNVVGLGRGVQAGTVNLARELSGAQIGTVNVAGDMQGFSVATVNVARRMKGFQLGVVNVTSELDGEALGVVSIIGNGIHNLDYWADEITPYNVGLKLGSRHIYTLLAGSVKSMGDSARWLSAWGLGGRIDLAPFFVDIDGLAGDIRRTPWLDFAGRGMLSRVRCTGGWQIIHGLALTAGPSLNVFVSDQEDGSGLPFYKFSFLHAKAGSTWIRAWPGFAVGLQGL